MYFEIIGEITDIETIAIGNSIREIARLRKQFGAGRWRKRKGIQTLFGLNLMKRKKSEPKFVICIQNEGCEDLEPRKVYRTLPDEAAAEDGYIRVIDESGEDYLYPQDYFVAIELPQAAEKALLSAA
jgi:hypothetical protein